MSLRKFNRFVQGIFKMNRDEQIQKLSRAFDWRAVLIILTSAFAEDGRVWPYVNLERAEIAFPQNLDDGTFSSREKILLAVAASLFNRDQLINLWEVLNRLDERNTALVLRAIRSFCSEEEPRNEPPTLDLLRVD
ncbi:MAG TPA: hypothetical protein VE422_45680 [Terriglobia bacterium]|nr:hypothetical protein [Terriglobia bacterium]